MTFAALGDYGVGIVNGEAGRRQAAVARTLTWLADRRDLRCVVGLGDNIYGGDEDRLEQSGDEDDDWFFTFYEPYRHVIDRLPFYPAAGNHDGPDEEANDDGPSSRTTSTSAPDSSLVRSVGERHSTRASSTSCASARSSS